MEKIKLTKREYVGKWNYHSFLNVETGEEKFVECSDEQYKKMGQVGGSEYNPKDEGNFKWVGSTGGSDKINTTTGLFQEGDYTINLDGKYLVCQKRPWGTLYVQEYSEEEFNNIWQ